MSDTTLGRPTSLDKIIGKVDGQLVTARDLIPDLIRKGNYLETAAARAGVRKTTVHAWLRTGAQAFNRQHTANQLEMPCSLTPMEKACIAFLDAVALAEAEYEVEANDTLGLLANGGIKTVKTTVKRGPRAEDGSEGPILEETTVTEYLAPDKQVLEWRMTRRFPEKYGNKIEVTDGGKGADLGDGDVAEQLIGSIEEFLGAGQQAE